MSRLHVVGLMVFILASATLGIYSTWLHFEMINQINAKLSDEKRFSGLGSHHFKFRRLLVDYRRFYSSGLSNDGCAFLAISASA